MIVRPIRIVTFNARSLVDLNRRRLLLYIMRNLNADIVCFQESYLEPEIAQAYFDWAGVKSVWSRLVGIIALSQRVLLSSPRILSDRVVTASFRIDDAMDISIASVYAPSNQQMRRIFFQGMSSWDLPDACILAGDFNSYSNPVLDYTPADTTNLRRRPEWSILAEELDRRNLMDAFRSLNPTAHQPTRSTPNRPSTRIDYFFIPQRYLNRCASPLTEVIPGSDHHALILDMVPNGAVEQGPGRWQLPTMLLYEDTFCNRVESLWNGVLNAENEGVDKLQLWDDFKVRVCREAKLVSQWLHHHRTYLLECYSSELRELEAHPTNTTVWAARTAQLVDLINQERFKSAQQQLLTTRERWIEKGERPTRYFYRMMAGRKERMRLSGLRDENGLVDTDLLSLLSKARNFYEGLYKKEAVNEAAQSFFTEAITTSCTHADRVMLNAPISTEEFDEVISHSLRWKAAGPDGLTNEFYRCFAHLFAPFLSRLAAACTEGSLVPASFSESVLALLYKKGDRFDLKNWRPIALMNCDAKFFTKILCKRLLKVIPQLIHSNQKGFIPGRSIHDHTRLMRTVLEDDSLEVPEGALLLLDFEKAYDRVDHSFLSKVLDAFGFLGPWRTLCDAMYRNNKAWVLVNGFWSAPVMLQRGVRQGDPLSPLLFNLTLEPFLIRMRQALAGIQCRGVTLKDLGFADDVSLFLHDSNDVLLAVDVLERYEAAATAKVNREKSLLVPLGNSTPPSPFRPLLPTDKFSYLGITFTRHGIARVSMETMLAERVEQRLRSFQDRHVSLRGRILLANVFALSRIWYASSVVNFSRNFVSRVKKAIRDFIWNGRACMIAFDTLSLPLSHGGLALMDPEKQCTAIFASWWRILASTEPSPLRTISTSVFMSTTRAAGHSLASALKEGARIQYQRMRQDWCQALIKAWHYFRGRIVDFSASWTPEAALLLPISSALSRRDGSAYSPPDGWRNHGFHTVADILEVGRRGLQLKMNPCSIFNRIHRALTSGDLRWTPAGRLALSAPSLRLNIPSFLRFCVVGGTSVPLVTSSSLRASRLQDAKKPVHLSPDFRFSWVSHALHRTLLPKIQSLLFLFFHGNLWSAHRLSRIPNSVVDPRCVRCGHDRETDAHRFFECPESVRFWKDVKRRLVVDAVDVVVDLDHCLASLRQHIGASQTQFVFGVGMWCIYRTHLAHIMDNGPVATAQHLLADFLLLARQLIQAKRRTAKEKRTLDAFKRSWERLWHRLSL